MWEIRTSNRMLSTGCSAEGHSDEQTVLKHNGLGVYYAMLLGGDLVASID